MAFDDPILPRRPQRRFWPALVPPLAGLVMLGALVGYLKFSDIVQAVQARVNITRVAIPPDLLKDVPQANPAPVPGIDPTPAGSPVPPAAAPAPAAPAAPPGPLPSQDVAVREVHTIPTPAGSDSPRRFEPTGTLPDLGPGATGTASATGAASPGPSAPPPVSAGNFLIGPAKALDGRTLEIDGRSLRLIGVDAPPAEARCRKPNGAAWACGEMVRTLLAGRLSPGAPVTCLPTGGQAANIPLATCRDATGTDLGSWLVMQGNALAAKESPEHGALETYARQQKLGLWADGSLPFRR